MNTVTLGTIALDTIKTPFGRVKNVLGGSGVYFSIAANFFTECGILGVVGKDFPRKYMGILKSTGVDLSGVEYSDGKTFRWTGSYDYDMNRAHTLKTELNVLEKFNPKIPTRYKNCKFLFLANIDPELQIEVLKKIKPKYSFCDTMNFWIEHKKKELLEVIGGVDMVMINEGEAREICNTSNLIKAGRSLLDMGVKKLVIKKGEHGALFFSNDTFFSVSAYPLENVVDPTGAGDSFAGGTVGYLAKNGSIDDSMIKRGMVYGSVMASYVIESFSVEKFQNLNKEKIQERYNKFKEIVAFEHLF